MIVFVYKTGLYEYLSELSLTYANNYSTYFHILASKQPLINIRNRTRSICCHFPQSPPLPFALGSQPAKTKDSGRTPRSLVEGNHIKTGTAFQNQ
ncbi:hypothetical protein NPIL_373771 [Nephila pilipes]|uniref:Uncharacterized protein n=1 Tax=Nephila pilipes TaxID=299642 RepID=A0A8X6P2P3_NEPPI|nr:hypothetical protein NPIL_373771 [Nephila pilipes]